MASQSKKDKNTDISTLTSEELKRIDALSYENARDELIEVVKKLESGGLNLQDSLHQWEIGQALAKRAQFLLDQVREKLEEAQQNQASAGANAGTQIESVDPKL